MQYIRYIPLFLFTIFMSKLLIVGATWQDAPIALILAATAAFFEFKTSENAHQKLEKVLEKQNDTILAMAKAIDEVRTGVASAKIAQGFRPTHAAR